MNKRYKFLLCVSVSLIFFWIISKRKSTKSYAEVKEMSQRDYDEELNEYNRRGSKIFDLNFNYIINPTACENSSDYLSVIIVTSYFGNVELRSSMRRSYSNDDLKSFGMRRVFLLGLPRNGTFVERKSIEDESKRFDDIVQGNFVEAYRNLTYKHVMGLNWASEFCPNSKYVIKMDDDIVIDFDGIRSLLKTMKLPSKNYIAGHLMKGMDPKRDPANKWYVTYDEFKDEHYPPFMSGWFYVTTPEFARNVSLLASDSKYFWIDDLYVTGVLARKLSVRFLNLNRYFAVHTELLRCCLKDLPRLRCDYLVGPNGGDNNMFYVFNKLTNECRTKKCSRRKVPLEKTCVLEKTLEIGNGSAVIESYNLRGR